MPRHQGQNDLLALLLGQQPAAVDPRGPAILQQLLAGQTPENERLSNFNTALDFLSPSAAVDFQERTTPDLSQVGQQLGLTPEELDVIIRQSTGLQLSPLQAQAGEIAQAGTLPDLLNAFTKQGELGVSQQEADIKGREADVAAAAEERQNRASEIVEAQQAFDLNMQSMALRGRDAAGNKVSAAEQKTATALFLKVRENPEALEFFKGLLAAKDFKNAARFLELKDEQFESEVLQRFVLQPGAGASIRQSAAPAGGATGPSQQLLEDFLSSDQDAVFEKFKGIIQQFPDVNQ